jgi:hypothetical protein
VNGVSRAEVVPMAMTEGNGIGHRLPSTIRATANPQHTATDDQQVRAWIVKLLQQRRWPGSLLVEAHSLFEMLLRLRKLA